MRVTYYFNLFHIAMLSNLRRTTSQGVFVPIDNII